MPSIITLTSLALATLFALTRAEERLQLVESAFNTTAYNEFIDSVKKIGTPYDVAIDNGRTVIIPAEGKSIDLEKTDMALGLSLDLYSPFLKVGVDDDRSLVDGHPIHPLSEASVEWAESNGAKGMTSVPTTSQAQNGTVFTRENEIEERSPLSGSQLAGRAAAKNYFYVYGSFYRGCASPGQVISYTNQCHSQSRQYVSVAFGNADSRHTLRASMWPHHYCANRHNDQGRRTISVAPLRDSVCQERNTFSWYGRYCC